MSTVTLTIGPKSYTIACADGEEAHIQALGAMIAEKYALLGAARAPLEAQNLLFAALFLADELAEARRRPGAAAPGPTDAAAAERSAGLESEVEALRAENLRLSAQLEQTRSDPVSGQDLFGTAGAAELFVQRLEKLAERAEAAAEALEAAAATS